MSSIFTITGLLFILFLFGFAATCFFEKETRAGKRMILASSVLAFVWLSFGLLFPEATFSITILFWITVFLGISVLWLPLGKSEPLSIILDKTKRYDERHVIFGRMDLTEGLPQYEEYYSKLNPGMKRFDDHLRQMPDLGDIGSKYANSLDSSYIKAIFKYIDGFNDLADPGKPTVEPVEITPEDATLRIKNFAKYLGALDVRITRLQDYHVYSHSGRHLNHWGNPNSVEHKYAVVFSLEMKHEMIQTAPLNPAFTETADKYMKAADVGICLANYITELGYNVRAHVDAKYKVLLTALAHDAGIGELGRLGLIITPTNGPRVRLAAITTDIPLIEDAPINFGVQHFCTICKKCADNCPSHSIETNEKKEIRGVSKWSSSMESCFKLWKKLGTDCGLCIAVCPYSKPNSFYHKIVRYFSSRNFLARHIALFMDDFFYSRTPRHSFQPDWFSSIDKNK